MNVRAAPVLLPILLALAPTLAPAEALAQGAPKPPPAAGAPGAPAAPAPPPPPTFEQVRAEWVASTGKPVGERSRIIVQFSRFKTAECVALLEQIRKTDPDASIKMSALRTIGQVGVDPARQIIEGVLDSGAPNEQTTALMALGYIRPPVPPDRFLAVLADASKSALHQQAARALGGYPEPRVAEALVQALARIEAQQEASPNGPRTSGPVAGYLARTIVDALRQVVTQKPLHDWYVEKVLAKRSPLGTVQGDLVALAPRVDDPRVRPGLHELEKSKVAEVRAALADALGEIDAGKGEAAEDSLDVLTGLLRDKDEMVLVSAGVAIGRIGPAGKALDAVLKLCRARSPGLRSVGVGALGASQDPRAFAAAEKALGDKAFPVRAAAIATLEKVRTKEAVTALVGALKKNKEGRLHADILRALERLTGARPGEDHAAWDGWWSAVVADFELPDPNAPEEERKGGPRVETTTRNPTYYGSEVVSRRVVFIVDVSGSMSAQTPKEGEEPEPGKPAVPPTGPTRLALCQDQLRNVVAGLDKGAFFNIVSFHTTFQGWQKSIVPAHDKNKQSALAFVNALKPTGGTNIYDPLEAALLDPEVDTIYLLSDGSPGSGKFVAPDDICREIGKINSVRRVAIHTISIGTKSPLMERLAKENGGDALVR